MFETRKGFDFERRKFAKKCYWKFENIAVVQIKCNKEFENSTHMHAHKHTHIFITYARDCLALSTDSLVFTTFSY